MNVKAKKNNHFLNLLEDRKLAELYFSGKNMTEFNSLQLIKLQKNCKMINLKRTKEIKKFDFIYIFDLKLSFYDFLEKWLDKYPMGVYSEDTPRGYLEGGCRMEERNCPMCSQRKKERSPEEYKKLINRLSRIEGQIRGIRSMVENGAYCPDILVQSAAANAALNAFNKELLASHLRSCVANDIREGHDEVIDELVVTLQKLMK